MKKVLILKIFKILLTKNCHLILNCLCENYNEEKSSNEWVKNLQSNFWKWSGNFYVKFSIIAMYFKLYGVF